MLKQRGYTVHFLLSELEGGTSDEERAAMSMQWDMVHIVPYADTRLQSHADAWGGDDWYDLAVDEAAIGLSRTWRYDVCLVNYAWYSRVLDVLPPEVVRVIDTHAAFGDRRKRPSAFGASPPWYFTRAEDEGQCLDRADIVMAIEEGDQAWFESITKRQVRTVGHFVPGAFLPPRARRGTKLRGGYLASGDLSNQISIATLIRHWAADPYLSRNAELHVAGAISREIRSSHPFLVKHGLVDTAQDFYALADFSVNPAMGGSGLRIETVEALSYGRPLFATAEGMLGMSGISPPYVTANVEQMTKEMSQTVAADPELKDGTRWARETFLAYRDRHLASFNGVAEEVKRVRASGAGRERKASAAA